MGRPIAGRDNKVQITTRLDPDLLEWTRANVGPGKRFGSVTHAIESGLLKLKEEGSPARSRSTTNEK